MFSASLAATSLGEWIPQKEVKTFRMAAAALCMAAFARARMLWFSRPSTTPSMTYSPFSAITLEGDAMPKNDLNASTIFPPSDLIPLIAMPTGRSSSKISPNQSKMPSAASFMAFPIPLNSSLHVSGTPRKLKPSFASCQHSGITARTSASNASTIGPAQFLITSQSIVTTVVSAS